MRGIIYLVLDLIFLMDHMDDMDIIARNLVHLGPLGPFCPLIIRVSLIFILQSTVLNGACVPYVPLITSNFNH